MLVHGSCAALLDEAVLILGTPGSGKSDLVLRLLQRGWTLVADDQVSCGPEGQVTAPDALRGLLEVRGLGVFEGLAVADGARLRLAVALAPRGAVPRLPRPAVWTSPAGRAVPLVTLDPFEPSACAKVALALEGACGRLGQRAGAFAA